MADAEKLLQAVDIHLSVVQFNQDPQTVRMSDGAE